MLLKVQSMMDIKEVLLLWFINVLVKKISGSGVIIQLNETNNLLKNYTNQFLKKLKMKT